MIKLKIKVCGMKYHENIEAISSLKPHYLGFIFYEKSARNVTTQIPKIANTIQKVGVFVNAEITEINEKIKSYQLNCVQLHGNESAEFCYNLKSKNNNHLQIIKAFSIDGNFNFSILNEYENACDYFLFDTKGKLPGGNGKTFNWQLLSQYKLKKTFFLSGGISLENIPEIMKLNLPIHAIDINSQFEIEPGLKNVEKVKKAIQLLQ